MHVTASILDPIVGFLITAVVTVVNAVAAAFGAAIAFVLSLLPALPEIAPNEGPPELGTLGCAANEVCISPLKDWLNFFLPLGGLLILALSFLAIYSAVLIFRVFARWAKVL